MGDMETAPLASMTLTEEVSHSPWASWRDQGAHREVLGKGTGETLCRDR